MVQTRGRRSAIHECITVYGTDMRWTLCHPWMCHSIWYRHEVDALPSMNVSQYMVQTWGGPLSSMNVSQYMVQTWGGGSAIYECVTVYGTDMRWTLCHPWMCHSIWYSHEVDPLPSMNVSQYMVQTWGGPSAIHECVTVYGTDMRWTLCHPWMCHSIWYRHEVDALPPMNVSQYMVQTRGGPSAIHECVTVYGTAMRWTLCHPWMCHSIWYRHEVVPLPSMNVSQYMVQTWGGPSAIHECVTVYGTDMRWTLCHPWMCHSIWYRHEVDALPPMNVSQYMVQTRGGPSAIHECVTVYGTAMRWTLCHPWMCHSIWYRHEVDALPSMNVSQYIVQTRGGPSAIHECVTVYGTDMRWTLCHPWMCHSIWYRHEVDPVPSMNVSQYMVQTWGGRSAIHECVTVYGTDTRWTLCHPWMCHSIWYRHEVDPLPLMNVTVYGTDMRWTLCHPWMCHSIWYRHEVDPLPSMNVSQYIVQTWGGPCAIHECVTVYGTDTRWTLCHPWMCHSILYRHEVDPVPSMNVSQYMVQTRGGPSAIHECVTVYGTDTRRTLCHPWMCHSIWYRHEVDPPPSMNVSQYMVQTWGGRSAIHECVTVYGTHMRWSLCHPWMCHSIWYRHEVDPVPSMNVSQYMVQTRGGPSAIHECVTVYGTDMRWTLCH